MKLQALIYVTAMETGKRILGYFHNTGIKQMLSQELDGKNLCNEGEGGHFLHCFEQPNTYS